MMHVALLAGGDSSERQIALQSADQILHALSRDKYDIELIDVQGRSWAAADGTQVDKNDFSLRGRPFDYALILIHGTPGEDGRLQGYLEMMQVPFSSCSQVSSVLTFDKVTTKRTVAEYGMPVARGRFFMKGDPIEGIETLGLPLFVKPNASGSSFGVTRVISLSELDKAVEAAFRESDGLLIEECIAGREMACGILDGEVFPITEIVSKKAFFDYEAKYTAGFSEEITPADITSAERSELERLTRIAYRACRCRGIARVDFILAENGTPYMIEINSIPGMSAGSIVPKQARELGLSLGELFDRVIECSK